MCGPRVFIELSFLYITSEFLPTSKGRVYISISVMWFFLMHASQMQLGRSCESALDNQKVTPQVNPASGFSKGHKNLKTTSASSEYIYYILAKYFFTDT